MDKYKFWASVLLAVFAILTLAVIGGLTEDFDDDITDHLYGRSEYFFKPVSYMGGTIFIFGISFIVLTYQFIKGYKRDLFLSLFTLASALFVYQIIKEVVARPRPEYASLGQPTISFLSLYSYPSGHTVGIVTLFLVLCIYLFKDKDTIKLVLTFFPIPLAVGISMIAIGEHYLSDVIASVVLSVFCVLLVIIIEKDHNISDYFLSFTNRYLERSSPKP